MYSLVKYRRCSPTLDRGRSIFACRHACLLTRSWRDRFLEFGIELAYGSPALFMRITLDCRLTMNIVHLLARSRKSALVWFPGAAIRIWQARLQREKRAVVVSVVVPFSAQIHNRARADVN